MIGQFKTYKTGILAVEVIERFDNNDLKLVQKWFEEKLAGGCSQVNLLVKLDMAKVRQTEVNAFFENILYSLRHISDLGHIAVVAHSKFIKTLVPVDNFFFERSSQGRLERYFDVSQLEEALAFVEQK